MKKINSFLFGSLTMFFCILSVQSILAVDVPLKNGDTGAGSIGTNVVSIAPLSMTSVQTIYPVTVDLTGSDLTVDFTSTVGTAFISIVNRAGNVVYETVVDTYSTSEVIIPMDGLPAGKYTVKIAYGSSSLIGTIRL